MEEGGEDGEEHYFEGVGHEGDSDGVEEDCLVGYGGGRGGGREGVEVGDEGGESSGGHFATLCERGHTV